MCSTIPSDCILFKFTMNFTLNFNIELSVKSDGTQCKVSSRLSVKSAPDSV